MRQIVAPLDCVQLEINSIMAPRQQSLARVLYFFNLSLAVVWLTNSPVILIYSPAIRLYPCPLLRSSLSSSTSSSRLGRPGDTGRGFGWAFAFFFPITSPRASCLGMVMFRLSPPLPHQYPHPVWDPMGVSLKQEKPPRVRKFLASLVLGKDGYSGFLANKKRTPLMDPKPPNISQAIM